MTNHEFNHALLMIRDQYRIDSTKTAEASLNYSALMAWLNINHQTASFADFFERFVLHRKSAKERAEDEKEAILFLRKYGPNPTFGDLKEWAEIHTEKNVSK